MSDFYYIDFENTQQHGLIGIRELKDDDTVIIIYTSSACKTPLSLVSDIVSSEATVMPILVKNGSSNAADFQLLALMVTNADTLPDYVSHIIVSNDHGYDRAIEMLRRLGRANFSRASNILDHIRPARKTCNPSQTTATKNAKALMQSVNIPQRYHGSIFKSLSTCNTKTELHNNLVKELGQETATELYEKLKPHLCNLLTNRATKHGL